MPQKKYKKRKPQKKAVRKKYKKQTHKKQTHKKQTYKKHHKEKRNLLPNKETIASLNKIGGKTLVSKLYAFKEKYLIEKQIGKGAFGVVFRARSQVNKYDTAIVKVVSTQEKGFDFRLYLEFLFQRLFAHYGLAMPSTIVTLNGTKKRISGQFTYTDKGKQYVVILMTSIISTITEKINQLYTKQQLNDLTAAVLSLIVKISKHNLTHGDLHDENVAIIAEGAEYLPVAIDFGWSMYGVAVPRVDLIQFIRGLFFSMRDRKNNVPNLKYIADLLLRVYARRYKPVTATFAGVDKEFNYVFEKIYLNQYEKQLKRLQAEYKANGGQIPSIERILKQRSVKLFGNILTQDDSAFIPNKSWMDEESTYVY